MLTVEAVESWYGPSQALHGVDLEVRQGQMVALLGRNGMGKTTTIRAICGLSAVTRGRVRLDGRDVTGSPAHVIARLGLGLVPEGRRCFANLTVWENLVATARDGPWSLERVTALFPQLRERTGQPARLLSGGEQQMLAIGRALMTNPKLLLLDEATEGLAPVVRQAIWAAVRGLKADGLSILIVDKTLKELLPLADHCVILERGRSVWSGAPDRLAADAELQHRYLSV